MRGSVARAHTILNRCRNKRRSRLLEAGFDDRQCPVVLRYLDGVEREIPVHFFDAEDGVPCITWLRRTVTL